MEATDWWSSWRRDVAIFTAMVAAEISNVGLNTLFKAATSEGMSSYIFIVYSYTLGALILFPSTFFSRRQLPPLSFSIVCKMGLLGLLGSVYLIAGYTGLKLSSPTLASAVSNLTPAFTFILAILFRMEKISLRKKSSLAKIVGTIVSISGAFVATLYCGPPVFVASQLSGTYLRQSLPPPPPPSDSNWALGGGLVALEYILISLSYIVQAQILREYPSEFTMTLFYIASVSILLAPVSAVIEKSPKAWLIGSRISLVCIIATGILNPVGYIIHSWAVRRKGPVFVAMFRPLSIVIAIIMDAIFLRNSLYLGSLIGGTIISVGFYAVMWGKAREEKAHTFCDHSESSPHRKSFF